MSFPAAPSNGDTYELNSVTYVWDATKEVWNVRSDAVAIPSSPADVGLGNVANTSDADKPISTATQAALDAKAATADLPTAMSAVEARAGTSTTPRIIAPNILKLASSLWWTDVPYSTDADWSPSVNTQQIIDASTWAAPRTPTLPSGAVYGDRIAFMLGACSLAGGVIITGNINGVVGEFWRMLVPGERIPLVCVGGGQWMVENDGRIKTVSTIAGNGVGPDQNNSEAANAFFEVAVMDDLTKVSKAFTAYAGNPTVDNDGSTLTARRTCPVIVTGGWLGFNNAPANGWHQAVLQNKTTGANVAPKRSYLSGNGVGDALVLIDVASRSNVYNLRVRSSTGSLGANFYAGNFITIAEQ